MINVYLNQIEHELDNLILQQKTVHGKLRIRQDIHLGIEHSEVHEALKIAILYSIIKYKSELHSLNTRIDAANNAIKNLHQLRHKEKEEAVYDRTNPTSNED
jgi:hypothetical protein